MNQQENREIRISPDALIALVVAEAEDRELSAMPSLEEMNAAFPSILRKNFRRRWTGCSSRPNGNRNVKVPGALQSGCSWWPRRS